MRGHIQKRGKESWRICVSLGKGPDGKYKYHYETVRGTKTEAEKRLAEVLVELNSNELVRTDNMTLATLIQRWLEDEVEENAEPATVRFYRQMSHDYIIPALGRIPVQKLESIQIQQFYKHLLKAGRKDGNGGLSPNTVRHVHATLSAALSYAATHNLLRNNPCRNVKAPSTRRSNRKPLKVWNAEQAAAVLEAAATDRWRYGIYVALVLSTGLRVGEALALRWDNVNLDKRVLSVREAVKDLRQTTHIELGSPKTEAGVRPVTFDQHLEQLLRKHRVAQAKEKLAMGSSYTDHGLVISTSTGGYVGVSNITRTLNAIIKAAGVPKIPLKNLRHTHATLLLLAGVHPKTVQERLGHSDISVTLDTYSFVLPSLQAAAVEGFTQVIESATRKRDSSRI